jgi:tRNA(fMet)-specific endonuclease VapC
MTPLYLLDTNTVSHLIKRHPQATQRLLAVPMHSVCISAITAGELAFGLAKRPEAVALKAAVNEFLRRVEVLPWDEAVAQTYGTLRAQLQRQGTPLAALDMQIAAHAWHAKAVLVSSDAAFLQVTQLEIENWVECS